MDGPSGSLEDGGGVDHRGEHALAKNPCRKEIISREDGCRSTQERGGGVVWLGWEKANEAICSDETPGTSLEDMTVSGARMGTGSKVRWTQRS